MDILSSPRERYPKFNLYLNGDDSGLYFYNALRFSTHCDYCIYTDEDDPPWFTPFPHNILKKNNNTEYKEKNTADTIIVEIKNDIYYIISQSKNPIKMDGMIKINDLNTRKILSSYNSFITIDFLVDYEEDLIFLGALEDNNTIINTLRTERGQILRSFFLKAIIKEVKIVPNSLITLECRISGNEIIIHYFTNKVTTRFELYRAYGINIPLLIVQSLLKRKVRVTLMVDASCIINVDESFGYNFESNHYIFDLDETLICRGKPIHEIINFLYRLKSKGNIIDLLTKHTHHIPTTLKSIGLDETDFNYIKNIEIGDKKSTHIGPGSIFIDNEFPQRYDVRVNSNCNVLDLNQIDFTMI